MDRSLGPFDRVMGQAEMRGVALGEVATSLPLCIRPHLLSKACSQTRNLGLAGAKAQILDGVRSSRSTRSMHRASRR